MLTGVSRATAASILASSEEPPPERGAVLISVVFGKGASSSQSRCAYQTAPCPVPVPWVFPAETARNTMRLFAKKLLERKRSQEAPMLISEWRSITFDPRAIGIEKRS
jgi:hypothetical protein